MNIYDIYGILFTAFTYCLYMPVLHTFVMWLSVIPTNIHQPSWFKGKKYFLDLIATYVLIKISCHLICQLNPRVANPKYVYHLQENSDENTTPVVCPYLLNNLISFVSSKAKLKNTDYTRYEGNKKTTCGQREDLSKQIQPISLNGLHRLFQ